MASLVANWGFFQRSARSLVPLFNFSRNPRGLAVWQVFSGLLTIRCPSPGSSCLGVFGDFGSQLDAAGHRPQPRTVVGEGQFLLFRLD